MTRAGHEDGVSRVSKALILAARADMRALGMGAEQIASELLRVHGLRPRVAYRHAHGWTQEEAAHRISLQFEGGEPPDEQGTVWASQVSWYESWPAGGRQPPLQHLRLMALAYGTSVGSLLDRQDCEALSEDELVAYLAPSSSPAVPGRPAAEVAESSPYPGGGDRRVAALPYSRGSAHRRAALSRSSAENSGVHAAGTVAGDRSGGRLRVSRTLEVFDDWDDLMRRRTLLTAGGASAAGVLAPQLFAAVPLGGQSTAPEVFAARGQITDSFRRLDNLLGAASVYEQAYDHHRRLMMWHRAAPAAERAQVAALVADSGALMGWLNVDLEQYAEASRCYREAAEAAVDVGDDSMYAYLISRMSRVLADCGLHRDALRFANAAAEHAAGGGHLLVGSWVAVTRAYVHACLGAERACLSDINEAERQLAKAVAQGEPAPPCLAYFDEVHLEKWTGYALMQLGAGRWTVRAQAALERTAARWSGDLVRGAAEVSTAVAAARIAQGEIEEAVRWTRQAYDVAASTRSARNLRRVVAVRAQLAEHRMIPAVRELDEYLLTPPGSVSV
ncbi:helix-turn-helix domain-containing protein [Streptomyces sp. NPDC055025]